MSDDGARRGATKKAKGSRALVKALPEDARRHNLALVLQSLFPHTELSRADIARLTGLTRVTVSNLVADLIADGLVQEVGQRESGHPGKPGTLLSLARDSRSIVALNLADPDTIHGAVVDLSGTVMARDRIDITGQTGDAAIASAVDLARRLCHTAPEPVLGIGVGTPGMVDDAGVILNAPNRDWLNVPLRAMLEQELAVPAVINNDADASVLAEYSFGGRSSTIMVVQFALGVGAGLIIDGSLVRGHGSATGEIGHVSISEDGDLCLCGKRGCLETFIAVPPLRAALAAAGADADARRQVLEDAGAKLASVLAPLVAALDFDEIALSGPADLLGGALLESARHHIHRLTRSAFRHDVTMRTTSLGDDIVLLGAAAMVLTGQLGVS